MLTVRHSSLASYDVSTGLLVLEHAFPSDAPHVPCVKVDITLVLESIESEMLQPGTWLNIIGYIDRSALRKNRVLGSELTWGQTERGSVQALVVWSAGALRIGDYERILMQQHGMTKESQMTT